MDVWDEEYREPTADERSARRTLAVAIALINAATPLATVELRRDLYPDMGDAAFRKAFQRDRVRLAASGVVVEPAGERDGEQTWHVNEERSFVRENPLTPEDALVLDCMLLPMAADPDFPFAHDLRLALTKIDRSFNDTSNVRLPPTAKRGNNTLTRLEDCMVRGHGVQVRYKRANGTTTERVLLPYGLFVLRDQTYLVACVATPNAGSLGDPHTYLVSRIESIRELPRTSYAIPPDFDVREFILPPYQIGPTIYTATFFVPQDRIADIREKLGQNGSWDFSGERTLLSTDVSSEEAAVAWAISQGARPLSPDSLVHAWRNRLIAALGGDADD
ncbi:MAG: WYL domain-containing protein [Coriobacteriales bacterium]|nr:WYL domain-containing protein [Coriobacteriales bacterium]